MMMMTMMMMYIH